ncbi:hypothetical protein DdX_18740 [Ditylenchus destructor]|uniref:Uncharacterized protein n=1 Tax=Ditylenchus destructor TaxID=166010 RepID=A0AAD4ML02_9BILA|nr:hypothetical protein DdX_18740 [Ditylenchus destructor]
MDREINIVFGFMTAPESQRQPTVQLVKGPDFLSIKPLALKRVKKHYGERCGTLAADLFDMRFAAALVVLRAGYSKCDDGGCKHYVPSKECEDLVSWECARECPRRPTTSPSTTRASTPSGSEAPVVTELLYYSRPSLLWRDAIGGGRKKFLKSKRGNPIVTFRA